MGDVLFCCTIPNMAKYRFKAVDNKGNKYEGVADVPKGRDQKQYIETLHGAEFVWMIGKPTGFVSELIRKLFPPKQNSIKELNDISKTLRK